MSGVKVVLVDTGRGRDAAWVEARRAQLGLDADDELALLSWNHPRGPLPVVDHLVFGPTLDWGRREPAVPSVTLPRRSSGGPAAGGSGTGAGAGASAAVAGLPIWHPRRLAHGARWRTRRLTRPVQRRMAPIGARAQAAMPDLTPLTKHLSSAELGGRIRARVGVSSDGVATDFAIAVVRSRQASDLAAWADVVVPFDVRSRKAAWVLARRVPGPDVPSDVDAAVRILRGKAAANTPSTSATTAAPTTEA